MITFAGLGTQGRLGNALFQASATIGLALRNGDDYVFPSSWEYKDSFNIHTNKFSSNITYFSTYTEPYFHYTPIIYRPNMNITGYYQSWRYFDDCKEHIMNLFSKNLPEQSGMTSIHVRRGDYTTLGNLYFIDLAATSYYEDAIKHIGASKYFVFSDDINWCKNRFKGDQFIFIEECNPVISLALMNSCENNIIANSSFSWWGAYLNKNPNKIVIAPNRWFGHKLPHNINDLFPHNWICL